jgi:hypothetical protein
MKIEFNKLRYSWFVESEHQCDQMIRRSLIIGELAKTVA